MKNKLFTVLLTIGVTAAVTFIFTIISCNNKQEADSAKSSKQNISENDLGCDSQAMFTQKLLYPVNSAIADINNFYTKCATTLDQNGKPIFSPVHCFTVRAQDLAIAMGIPISAPFNFKYARVYIGYNAAIDSFKLFFVPVQGGCLATGKGGTDILIGSNGAPGFDSVSGKANGLNVLDLVAPCPSFCPENSILCTDCTPNSLKK